MDTRQMALEKVPHAIQIRFSFPPYPGAELKTIQVDLPEGALLLDAIRQSRIEHHIPVYLEHSFLSTAETLIHATRRAAIDQETKRVNQEVFSKGAVSADSTGEALESSADKQIAVTGTENDTQVKDKNDDEEELALQKAMIANYRNYTSQFYTQPEENMFPEAYHTLVHSPVPSLFDAILELEREYAGEVDALLSARDAEINDIQIKHNNALASDTPQRNLTHLVTRHVERMEVAQATWNSQLDDLQSAQRSKYQEFILELYKIYKRRQLYAKQPAQNGGGSGNVSLDGKDMVSEAMRTVGARKLNIDAGVGGRESRNTAGNSNKGLPPAQPPQTQPQVTETQPPQISQEQSTETAVNANQGMAPLPPPKPPRKKEEDVELNGMIRSILEMGFDVEQAKGALLIANRNMVREDDHAINLLLEQPENIPRLVLAKQKVDAMKENARRQTRALSSPQQPHPSLTGSAGANLSPTPAQEPRIQSAGRLAERSASVSYPRPMVSGANQGSSATPAQKPWSPIPFLQQQKNALLTNNAAPSVKKLGGWLNKAIENLGLDDDDSTGYSNSAPSQQPIPVSNLDESFTVVLGSSHSKVTHNLRLMASDPAEVFPSHRVKTERDAAIHAQTASSLYGQNLTGLVQLFFKACQTSTELHFDSIEKQLEALETQFPLDGSTLREGDFILTRHSNLPMIHVVFHLFYGQLPPSSGDDPSAPPPPHQLPMFSQSNDFVPRPDFLAGLKNIIRTAHRYEITMLSLPFLMMPAAFEDQLVISMSPEGSSSSRHSRRGSHSLSASSPPSISSVTSSPMANGQLNNGINNNTVYYITEQTRRDLLRRSETLLRHLKSFLMDNARQLKQVGNQGSEAEKFRASQGGDVKVVQFLLPKGTSDDMFRTFRVLLVNIFGGA
ncbi:hypothetical protein BGZ80_001161 [Entomortierella chlamydospora]|uniref:UBA domain-containing protein n=1 Tax=Entomortierella chlamydospora TaxID=101097 RepID=A0A9P6T3G5_9FUNG|nr:hypothetical protein BGZ80_001161 [Entomortierella chlamydospora]